MKQAVHFSENYLLNPTNQVLVNLIGAGGTGSQILTGLARINQALTMLGHPGLKVNVFESDTVSESNLARQLFSSNEIGLNKAVALVNRINRFFGLNWKAIQENYCMELREEIVKHWNANITISCVDTVDARYQIACILEDSKNTQDVTSLDKPYYWMDMGNNRDTGQVILSTIFDIAQPRSRKYETVKNLPFMTKEFGPLLKIQNEKNTPSCSLAEALNKQDLFINSALANLGGSLLWKLFREGLTSYRGFFLNLRDFRSSPLPV